MKFCFCMLCRVISRVYSDKSLVTLWQEISSVIDPVCDFDKVVIVSIVYIIWKDPLAKSKIVDYFCLSERGQRTERDYAIRHDLIQCVVVRDCNFISNLRDFVSHIFISNFACIKIPDICCISLPYRKPRRFPYTPRVVLYLLYDK